MLLKAETEARFRFTFLAPQIVNSEKQHSPWTNHCYSFLI